MEEMENKVEKLLSDPQSFSKIMSLASSVMETMKGGQKQVETAQDQTNEANAQFNQNHDELLQTQAETAKQTNDLQTDDAQAPGETSQASLSHEMQTDAGKAVASMLPTILSALGGKSDSLSKSAKERLNLLLAVKPFLQESHRGNIDRAANLVKAAQTAQAAMAGLSEGFNKQA